MSPQKINRVLFALVVYWIQPRELRPIGQFDSVRHQLRPFLFLFLLLFRLLLL